MHLQRGRFLKAKNKSFELYLSHWSSPSSFFTGSCTVFQIGLALPERICDLSLSTLALTMAVIRLEKSTTIASRKCCPSSTRQIRTSFCCIGIQAITAQNAYTLTRRPQYVRGQTVSLPWHHRNQKGHPFAIMSSFESIQRITRAVSPSYQSRWLSHAHNDTLHYCHIIFTLFCY